MAPILSKEQPPVTSNHLTQNVVFLKNIFKKCQVKCFEIST